MAETCGLPMKRVIITILICLFASIPTANADLKDAFDVYTSTPVSTYNSKKMQGIVGASFHARNKDLYDRDVFAFQAPSWGGGCGGIDIFAGSFSVITKDELVQMARGIAQGAPGYFFQLAIDSVCPSCGANMKELVKRLNQYNEMFTDSCNRFWDMVSDKSGINDFASEVQASMNEAVANNQTLAGLRADYGDWMANRSESSATDPTLPEGTTTAEVADVLNGNAIFILFDGQNYTDNLSLGIEPHELFMSLIGTAIINVENTSGTTDIEKDVAKGTVDFGKMMYGDDTTFTPGSVTSVTLKLTKCQSTDPECLEPIEDNVTWEPLVPKYMALISKEAASQPDRGLLQNINARDNVTDEQKKFMMTYKFNYIDWATKCYFNAADAVAELVARQAAFQSLEQVLIQLTNDVRLSIIRNPLSKDSKFTPQDIYDLIETANQKFKTLKQQSDDRVRELTQTLEIQRSISKCSI